MKLYLQDIQEYAFKSCFNDSIKPKTIYNDGIVCIYETSRKAPNWTLGKRHREEYGCVYFLLNDNEVVYIGQTVNEFRVRAHIYIKFTDIYFIPFKVPYHIKFENKLLEKYVTKFNKTGLILKLRNNDTRRILQRGLP